MPAPSTSDEFLELVRKSGVVEAERLDAYAGQLRDASAWPDSPKKLASLLVRDGLLTYFQSGQFMLGRWRGFTLGKYKVLERLGSGGMGTVYLCEHLVMRRRVAIKVLPINRADDPSSLGRFQREAQAAAALDHPNIVRAHDFSQEGNLHFLVMEYINGVNLQEAVQKGGPMEPVRAAHYVRQAALGLQHAHETAGLVHRDIKPGNILVDRTGTVKILDMGLARFSHERGEGLTSKYDEKSVLGTADYLSPEQAMSSHDADIRSDIYSLGATFYFLLTGRPPFSEGTVAQKIIWHQMRPPRPVREVRPEVPEGLADVVEKMLAKEPGQRYQSPAEVVEALSPWTQTPIAPPPETEFRRLSPAAMAGGVLSGSLSSLLTAPAALAPLARDGEAGPPSSSRPATDRSRLPGETPVPADPTRELFEPAATSTPATRRSANGNAAGRAADTQEISAEAYEEITDEEAGVRDNGNDLSWRARLRKPSWLVLAIGGAALLLVALVAFLLWHFLLSSSPASSGVPASGRMAADGAGGERVPGKPLVVALAGRAGAFPTLRSALEKAQPGDHIQVQQDILEEALRWQGKAATPMDVVVEGAAPSGKAVLWRAPPDRDDGKPLLELANVAGLRVKGFRLDGRSGTAELVAVSGHCPDLVLEDLQLEGFTRTGVRLDQCRGEAGRPVVLARLRTLASAGSETALALQAQPDSGNRYIRVSDSRFEGRYQRAVVELSGPLAEVTFERNRLFRAPAGFLYTKAACAQSTRLAVVSNTFGELDKGLLWEELPSAARPHLVDVRNNLFFKTKYPSFVDGLPLEPKNKTPAEWIWYDEGKTRGGMPPESRFFRKTFEVAGTGISRASVDIACDDGFTVWVNGERIGTGAVPYYDKHASGFDIKRQLHPGKNVVAIEGFNLDDPGQNKWTDAALLVHLTYQPAGNPAVTVLSDKSWKVSKEGPKGWQEVDFDDSAWTAAKEQGSYKDSKANSRKGLVWDAFVAKQLPPGGAPIQLTASDNIRDWGGGADYPMIGARGINFQLSEDVSDDAHFLRYAKNSPLDRLGSPGVPPAGAP